MTLPLIFALLNAARGRKWLAIYGKGNDWMFAILCGLSAGVVSQSLPVGIIVLFGMRIGEMSGWGFDEITGDFSDSKYHEWIQAIGLLVFPRDGYARTNKRRGVLMRTLRSVYYYPLFIGLAWFNPWGFLIGLACVLQGAVYGLVGMFGEHKHSVAGAEALAGGLMGFLIALTIGG